jgi:hypothetical protein
MIIKHLTDIIVSRLFEMSCSYAARKLSPICKNSLSKVLPEADYVKDLLANLVDTITESQSQEKEDLEIFVQVISWITFSFTRALALRTFDKFVSLLHGTKPERTDL